MKTSAFGYLLPMAGVKANKTPRQTSHDGRTLPNTDMPPFMKPEKQGPLRGQALG